MNNYSEQVLQAVDMVVQQRLNDISFDKTILCKIVDDKQKDNGQYTVEYENTKMTAYATEGSQEYKIGRQVYVLVPQGDFNLNKVILGETKTSELPVYMYINPIQSLIRLSDNLMKDKRLGETLDPIILRDYSEEGGMPPIKYLAFAGDFKTILLDNTSIDYTKTYGIEITGKGLPKTETEDKDEKYEDFTWVFNNTEFQGNPYSFNGLYRQEQLFNIEKYSKLKELRVNLQNNTELDVNVSNIELYYGYSKKDWEDRNIKNQIIMYEENNREYYPQKTWADDFQLNFNTKFYYDQSLVENSDNYNYQWYIYDQQAEDVGNGKFWARILTYYEDETVEGYENKGIDYTANNRTSLNLSLNTNLVVQTKNNNKNGIEKKIFPVGQNGITRQSIQLMVQVWRDGTKIATSNNLVVLRDDLNSKANALANSGIELAANDGGKYYIYDDADYQIINELAPSTSNMVLTAKLSGAAEWQEGATAVWRFPMYNTMLESPVLQKKDSNGTSITVWNPKYLYESDAPGEEIEIDGVIYYALSLENQDTSTDQYVLPREVIKDQAPTQKYGIKSQYDMSATNNIVQCQIFPPNNQIAEYAFAGISLDFGVKGIQGTDYTLAISLSAPFLTVYGDLSKGQGYNTGSFITATATLFDPDNQEVNIGSLGGTCKWSWDKRLIQSSLGDVFPLRFLDDSNTSVDTWNDTTCKIDFIQGEDSEGGTLINLDNYCGVLRVTLSEWQLPNAQKIHFSTTIPIPIFNIISDNTIANLQVYGALKVVYDFQGKDPVYSSTPYSINTNRDEYEIELLSDGRNNISLTNDDKLVVPYFTSTNLPKVTVKFNITEVNNVLYQPIEFARDEYSSDLLNSWNGTSELENDTTIVTKILGAGEKNFEGQFSGVFMGAVGDETGDGITGLYGYQDGKLRFKFTEKGEAYIGTGADNCIAFNTLQGGDAAGVDLKRLTIRTKHFTLDTEDKIYLSDIPNDSGHIFELGDKLTFDTNGMLYIANDLKVSGDTIVGGTIKAQNNDNMYWNLSTGAFQAGSNFRVGSDGAYIGGWTILDGRLECDRVFQYDGYRTGMQCLPASELNQNVDDSAAFFAGCTTSSGGVIVGNSAFYVTQAGKLYASNAEIIGTLRAGSVLGLVEARNEFIQLGKIYMCYDSLDQYNRTYFTSRKSFPSYTGSSGQTALQIDEDVIALQGYVKNGSQNNFSGVYVYSTSAKGELFGTWKYGNSGPAIDSDVNKKNTIKTISDVYSVLFDNLRPVTYKYNNGTSNRLHTGFIAQEVQEALNIANIDSNDFAGLVIFDKDTEKEEWALRYEEFIALNTQQIQKLKTKVSELETELTEIKEKLK